MKFIFYFISLNLILVACNSKGASDVAAIPSRDTTIQPENAFTLLVLDSSRVASFLAETELDDSVHNKITGFYNERNYQYAWFTEEGLSEAGEAFWNLHQELEETGQDSLTQNNALHLAMQNLADNGVESIPNDSVQILELNLTTHFFSYVKKALVGTIDPKEMQWHIPKRKLNAVALLDSFLLHHNKSFQPLNPSFYRLQDKLKMYSGLLKAGGWNTIELAQKSLRQGVSAPEVTNLKKRLQLSGDFTEADTSSKFTPALTAAVKRVQKSYGMKEDGVVTKSLVAELNVPAEERVQQMLINLERLRWLPETPENRIVANIPEYRLHVYEGGKEVFGLNIVVGKAANRTVVFSDELQYVVFSPYWNVPQSIVKNEIVPAMNRSSSYLSRNNMEITGRRNGYPIVRQKPGGSNSLGRVKFIFPNSYNIYFHDTPAKTLFNKESRAFSHGCVRVQDPSSLAEYLLRNESKWTDAAIKKAMYSGKEKWVKLDKPVPVYLLYLTSWVDEEGLLHFRDDIYGHDKRLAARLFINPAKG